MGTTIRITGSSSGIGKTTAQLFHACGWNVVVTMRAPNKETDLTTRDTVLVTTLDLTEADSIRAAVDAGIARFGQIDVLLNTAGVGVYGAAGSDTERGDPRTVRGQRVRPARNHQCGAAARSRPARGPHPHHLVHGRGTRLPARHALPNDS